MSETTTEERLGPEKRRQTNRILVRGHEYLAALGWRCSRCNGSMPNNLPPSEHKPCNPWRRNDRTQR